MKPWKAAAAGAMSALLFFGQTAPLLANPVGGQVAAGSATIISSGSTETINQSSASAIINWQQFSINSGELTKFLVPNSSSATLNRVLGGNPSLIYGTLQSNGIVYVINPSGIVVGPNGRIDTAGFIGSTLDLTNQQFLQGGNLDFVGNSSASIDNQGVISASSGDVYLIAAQVSNSGTITAPQGTAGLAAASNVLYQPVGNQHLFVQANPVGTTRAVGVTNTGTVRAARAELTAAGGNAYALAINNSGNVAATGFKKINGQVYLTSDGGNITNSGQITAQNSDGSGGTIDVDGSGSGAAPGGTVTNSGALDASASTPGTDGGAITLKSVNGSVSHTGQIFARGGLGGVGGNVDISGSQFQFTGSVDLTAPNGQTGNLLLDPVVLNVSTIVPTLTVITTGTGTITGNQNDNTSTTIAPSTVDGALNTANIILEAQNNITISNGMTWTSGNTLTLETTVSSSTININAPISGVNGGLTISAAGATDQITTGANGSINVSSFTLNSGSWNQVVGQNGLTALPSFSAANNFTLAGISTFLRAAGGTGATATPYQITDIYGLQGIGSPSGNLLGDSFVLNNSIDASGTSSWNSGAGFVPIGTSEGPYTGTFNGANNTISNLTINLPGNDGVGMFGYTDLSTLENVGLTSGSIAGGSDTGGLVGFSAGTVNNCYFAGTVTGGGDEGDIIGGLMGGNSGLVEMSHANAAVTGGSESGDIGGLVGFNDGTVETSYATGTVTGNGSTAIGGLVGENNSIVKTSFAIGGVSGGGGSEDIGGLVGFNEGTVAAAYATGAVSGGSFVGGLVGFNTEGTVETAYSTGAVSGNADAGGLIGDNSGGTVETSYWAQDTGLNTGLFGIGSASNNTGATPETVAALETQSTFTPSGASVPDWDFVNTWTTDGNTNTPQLIGLPTTTPPVITGGSSDMLSGTAYIDSGTTPAGSGLTIDLLFDGTLLGSTITTGSGGFSFTISSTDLTGGVLLTDVTDKGDTYYQATNPASTISGIDTWGNTLRVIANTASNGTLGTAVGSLSGDGINYSVTGGNLFTNSGVNMVIVNGYNLDGNITTGGSFTTETSASVTGSQTVTLTSDLMNIAGNFNLTGSLNLVSSGGAVILDDATIDLNGANFSATGSGFASTLQSTNIGDEDGVDVYASTINAAGGNIAINGTGGYYQNSFFGPTAVSAGSGVNIGDSLVETTGSGNITITGTAGLSGTSMTGFTGVDISNQGFGGGSFTGSTILTQNGVIAITGAVNSGMVNGGTEGESGGIYGVVVQDDSLVQASGGNGAIAIIGDTAGSSNVTDDDVGVEIEGYDDNTGTAHTATISTAGDGVAFDPVATTFNGIYIQGTGGSVTNTGSPTGPNGNNENSADGISLTHGATITTANGTGSITMIGQGGSNTNSSGTSGEAQGIDLSTDKDGNDLVQTGGSGNITLIGVAGSSPSQGIGILVAGTNGSTTKVETDTGSINLNGTGGSGYTGTGFITGEYVPNPGVAIADYATVQTGGTGAINISGAGGANSHDVVILELPAGSYDSSPTTPTITAGGDLTVDTSTSNGHGIYLDADVTAANITLGAGTDGSPGSVTSGPLDIAGADITLTGGAFDAFGMGVTTVNTGPAIALDGIDVEDSTINAQGGNITLTGAVGALGNAAGLAGVQLGNTVAAFGPVGPSTLETSGSGNITITGDGSISGISANNLTGVTLINGSQVTVQNGALDIQGTVNGGGSTDGYVIGVDMENGANAIKATGTGSVTISGTAGSNTVADFSSYGVQLSGSTVSVAGGSSGINITGQAGDLTKGTIEQLDAAADGIEIDNGATITASGAAPVTLTGTGGTDNNTVASQGTRAFGIYMVSGSGLTTSISSASGNIQLTGTGGSSPVDTVGLSFYGAGGTASVSSGSGNIDLQGSDPDAARALVANGISFAQAAITAPGANANVSIDTAGDVTEDSSSVITTSLLTIANAAAVTLNSAGNAISALGTIFHSGALSVVTDPGLAITGVISGNAPVTLETTGGDITFGSGGQIQDSGNGNNVILAAGTNLANSHYIINNSSAGANAIDVSGENNFFYIYSSDPSNDTFGGITVPAGNVLYNQTYPAASLPSGNAELFYVAAAGDVGPNAPQNSNSSTSSSTENQTQSQLTPPNNTISPQPPPPPPPTDNNPSTPTTGTGNGTTNQTGNNSGQLADASGSSGDVGSGDAAQLNDGQLNNVANPAASAALNQALSPAVEGNLLAALQSFGDFTTTNDTTGNDNSNPNGTNEQDVSNGEVVEMQGGSVQNVPPDQVPQQLKNALNSNVLENVPANSH